MFCHNFIHIKPNLFDFSIADSDIDVRPAININRLLKKKLFFHILVLNFIIFINNSSMIFKSI